MTKQELNPLATLDSEPALSTVSVLPVSRDPKLYKQIFERERKDKIKSGRAVRILSSISLFSFVHLFYLEGKELERSNNQ